MSNVTDEALNSTFNEIISGVTKGVEETVSATYDSKTSALKETTFGVKFSIPTLYTTIEHSQTLEILDYKLSEEETKEELTKLKRSVYDTVQQQAGNYISLSKALQESLK